MTRTKKVGPAGSFAARYGTVARKRYADIISQLRIRHECPQCQLRAVRRISVGIWFCGHCGLKFAGGAYVPVTKLGEVARRAARGGAASMLAETQKKPEPETPKVEEKPKKRTVRRQRPKEEPSEEKAQ